MMRAKRLLVLLKTSYFGLDCKLKRSLIFILVAPS